MEGLSYFLAVADGTGNARLKGIVNELQNTPRAEWPARNGSDWHFSANGAAATEKRRSVDRDGGGLWKEKRVPHWAELSERW